MIPLIQAGVNDTFWFSLGGFTKSVILTPGNYSGTDLAALLYGILSNKVPEITWTVTYNNHLASLSIFCTDQTFQALTDTAGRCRAQPANLCERTVPKRMPL